ncbi:MAG: hypothetical protein AVDCRST_MAG25-129 [uncultured Rubrobacteraceae bacterium]|uniref:Uncharacterized protein n=1 Tax=uncultured Rubrobacteraceae bacterium TaxID=349277 RepID=A0A6J4R003_9ACTN|nr:MAG: hypothetical protein AVDCRST_MAG25-129 [uncultured Rubrobacteraceae bacterium]
MVEKGAMAVPAAGLHARFINEAKYYSSEMPVVKNRIRANAKGSLRHMAHGEKVGAEGEQATVDAVVAIPGARYTISSGL